MLELIEKSIEALPIKLISNAMLAMILALLIIYIYVSIISRVKRPKDDEIMKQIELQWSISNPIAVNRITSTKCKLSEESVIREPKLSRRERKRSRSERKKLKNRKGD